MVCGNYKGTISASHTGRNESQVAKELTMPYHFTPTLKFGKIVFVLLLLQLNSSSFFVSPKSFVGEFNYLSEKHMVSTPFSNP